MHTLIIYMLVEETARVYEGVADEFRSFKKEKAVEYLGHADGKETLEAYKEQGNLIV
jgi:hypothetical protein